MQLHHDIPTVPDEVLLANLYGPRATRYELGESDESPMLGDERTVNSRSAGEWRSISMADVDSRRTCKGHEGRDLTRVRIGRDPYGRYICADACECGKPLAVRS